MYTSRLWSYFFLVATFLLVANSATAKTAAEPKIYNEPALCRKVIAGMEQGVTPVEVWSASSLCGFHVVVSVPSLAMFASICPGHHFTENYAFGADEDLVVDHVSYVRHPDFREPSARKESSIFCNTTENINEEVGNLNATQTQRIKTSTREFIQKYADQYRSHRADATYVHASDLPESMNDIVEWFVNTMSGVVLDIPEEWTTRRERIQRIGVEYWMDAEQQLYYLLVYRNYRDRGHRPPVLFRVYHHTSAPVYDRHVEAVLDAHNYLEDSKEYWFAR